MTRLGALFGGASTATVATVATAGAGVLVVVGIVAFVGFRTPTAPEQASDVATVTAPDETVAAPPSDPVAVATEEAGSDITTDAPEAAIAIRPPTFDIVRVEADGTALIAGRAAPDATVTILMDGMELTVAQADAIGSFVAILRLAPSDLPRSLSLISSLDGSDPVPGEQTVLIAPIPEQSDATAPRVADATAPPTDSEMPRADAPAPDVTLPKEPMAQADAPASDPGLQVAPSAETTMPQAPDVGDAVAVVAPSAIEPEPVEVIRPDVTGPAEPGMGQTVANAEAPRIVTEPSEPTGPLVQQQVDETALAVADADDDTAPPADLPDQAAQAPEATPMASAVDPPEDLAPAEPGDTGQGAIAARDPAAMTEAAAPPQPRPSDAAPADIASSDPPADRVSTAPAPVAPTVLLADTDGVRVLQGPGDQPQPQTEVQLDTISYDAEGAVFLAGRGPADTSVRVLLDNQPIRMGEVGPGGEWRLNLPDVDPGTYTLRVEQLDQDGTVTARVETPFLREDPERIALVPMRAPDGVSIITVQPGFTLWGIAETNFGEGILYVSIFEQNRGQIRDPDLIFPGQIFDLPDLPRVPMTP